MTEELSKIGLYMKIIQSHMRTRMTNDAASLGVTAQQIIIMRFLFKNTDRTIHQNDIEKEFCLKHPTVTGILSRLEKNGFITTVVDESDRRCKTPALTDKALKVMDEMQKCVRKADKQMLAGLSDEEVKTLEGLLEKVKDNLI